MNKFKRYKLRKRMYRFLGIHWFVGVPMAGIGVVYTIILFIKPFVMES